MEHQSLYKLNTWCYVTKTLTNKNHLERCYCKINLGREQKHLCYKIKIRKNLIVTVLFHAHFSYINSFSQYINCDRHLGSANIYSKRNLDIST